MGEGAGRGSAAGKKTLDGRRPGRGIYLVAVDEAVVGAAPTRWTTAPMKREEAMKGSWSNVMDERRLRVQHTYSPGISPPS